MAGPRSVLLALVLTLTVLAPAASADPFVCFVDVDAHCALGYDTPDQHVACDALPPDHSEREQLFVDQGPIQIAAGHECSREEGDARTDSTYATLGDTTLAWGPARTTSCDVVVTNAPMHVDLDSPCPAGQRVPDLLP